MKTRRFVSGIVFILCLFCAGCIQHVVPAVTPAVDLDSTVNAAVDQTAQAAANPTMTPDVNATIDSAVAATGQAKSAMQATIESGVAATVAAMPSPTAVPVEELTEEQLAAEVGAASEEADAACEEVASAADDATADAILTEEEIELILYLLEVSEDEINQALELAETYASMYGELAEETIELLYLVEEDLNALLEYTDEVLVLMEEAMAALEKGQDIAQEVIAELQGISEEISHNVQGARQNAIEWQEKLAYDLENRPEKYTNIAPDTIADNRTEAIRQARDYIDSIKESLVDGKISSEEMNRISLLSANASASLRNIGGDEMMSFADTIDTLTIQLAKGEMPQARNNLNQLNRDFPERPKR